MNISDYVKEHVYLPYFRRQSKEVRLQQILLGLGIGLAFVALGALAWYLVRRHGDDEVEAAREALPESDEGV